ncbi:MAG: WD40/YVTN/BNR-like repeat-containing protein [Ktedonobacterales bacterium]
MRLRLWVGRWGVLAAVLVVLAGCGASVASAPTHPAGILVTLPPATPVARGASWQQVMLPQQVTAHQITGFAVSPLDGRDAWLCIQMSATSPDVWATRDFGATWMDMGTLPQVTSAQGPLCNLVADANDTHALAAIVSWGSGEAGTLQSATLTSTDGGTHWGRISGDMRLLAMASQGATTYAILHDTAAPSNSPLISLIASTDGLHTWRSIAPPELESGDTIFAFWLRPASTEVIAASIQDTLWRSTDGGAHWARITTPHMQVSEAAWQPTTSRWVICGTVATAGGTACSTDLGQTWPVRQNIPSCYADVILPDGTLLSACPPNGGDGTQTDSLYEMPLDATTWTSLGTLPEPYLYAATATGQLWCGDLEVDALEVATLPA